jgi:hypothetical protein
MRKVLKPIRRIHGKNLCVHGEKAKRPLAYSPNTSRDTKLSISQLIMVQHESLLRSLLSVRDGLDEAKNHFTRLSVSVQHAFCYSTPYYNYEL